MRPFSVLLAAALVGLSVPAAAQTPADLDKRVRQLETEMRAVRKRVLPSGEARLIEPEVDTAAAPPVPAQSTADKPLVALSDRVASLESQQRQLTATIEEQSNRLRLLEEAARRFQSDAEFRLGRLEGSAPLAPASAAPAAATGSAPPAEAAAQAPAVVAPARPAPAGGAAVATASAPASAAKPAAPKPAATGVEGQFEAAYELVRARDWVKAQPALEGFIAANPKHALSSNARYWLGRTHFAQGRFETSARVHFDNYQAAPKGDRAQESLYWVGQSLVRLKRQGEACKVYDLARTVYAEEMKPELVPQFAAARKTAACS